MIKRLVVIFSLNFTVFANFHREAVGKHFDENKFQDFINFTLGSIHGHQTNTLIIYKDDKLIYEKYQNHINKNTPQKLWSISKSISSLIFGIAQDKDLINLNDPLKKFFPKTKHKNLNLSHFFYMNTGLNWNEDEKKFIWKNNLLDMLYHDGIKNTAQYTINRESIAKEEKIVHYNSGNTNVLMKALQKSMGPSDYNAFPWNSLFNPLRIKSATFEQDLSGNFIGSSYIYMSARDLLKIAKLFISNGKHNNKQIISTNWFSLIKTKAKGKTSKKKFYSYCGHIWCNKNLFAKKLPKDTLISSGYRGQVMMVIPSLKFIMIRLANDNKNPINYKKMYYLLTRSFK